MERTRRIGDEPTGQHGRVAISQEMLVGHHVAVGDADSVNDLTYYPTIAAYRSLITIGTIKSPTSLATVLLAPVAQRGWFPAETNRISTCLEERGMSSSFHPPVVLYSHPPSKFPPNKPPGGNPLNRNA